MIAFAKSSMILGAVVLSLAPQKGALAEYRPVNVCASRGQMEEKHANKSMKSTSNSH